MQTAPLKRGEWATLRLEATPSGISLSRDGDPAWKTTAQDGGQQGGYLALVKGYRTPQTVRFRDVAVLATP